MGGRLDTVPPNSQRPSDYPSETHRLGQRVDVRHAESKQDDINHLPSVLSKPLVPSSTVKEDDSSEVIRVIIVLDDPVIGYLRAVHFASEEQVIRREGPPGRASVPGRGLGKGPPHEKNRGLVWSPRVEICPDHSRRNPRRATL